MLERHHGKNGPVAQHVVFGVSLDNISTSSNITLTLLTEDKTIRF